MVDKTSISGGRAMLGILLAPWALVATWVPPGSFADFSDSRYLVLLVLNGVTAYVDFIFHLAVCHFILRKTRFGNLGHYCLVMAVVSLLIHIALDLYYLHGINGLGYGHVTVLRGGEVTPEGAVYLQKEALYNSLAHVAAVTIFWIVAVGRKGGFRLRK